MPPAAYKAGHELKIELDVGPPAQPGSVITGRVVRTAPGVSPRATVSIRLLGRVKTKLTVTRSNGQTRSRSFYRNRFNFFEPTQTRQFLLDGPLHVAPGSATHAAAVASWPFAVEIPLHPSPRSVRSEAKDADTCFLSLSPEDIASSSLPASFTAEGQHRNVRFEAYVEYHLEALMMTTGNHGKDVTAVLPIQIRQRPMLHPLSDFEIHRGSIGGLVSTYHLVPGMEKAELSFKQKTKQLFGSSKVPTFGYTLHVDCPAIIQLGNPSPIPFSMRLMPNKFETSGIVHEVDQTVALTSLEIVLKAHTAVIAPTTFSSQAAHDVVKHSISLPVTALGQIVNPPVKTEAPSDTKGHVIPTIGAQQKPLGLILPSKWQAGDETALDIGAGLDLRLYSTHATALGRPISRMAMGGGGIMPGFETYCVRHSHTLKWKVVLEIAGKTVKHESEQTVTIVAPGEPPPPLPSVPVAAVGMELEELPSYRASAQLGGPSNSSGVTRVHIEELPSYEKQ